MAADTAGVGRTTEAQVPAKDYRHEFYLAEFNVLRKEVEIRLAEINQIEYQVFLGAAATYAWLLTRPTDISALSKVVGCSAFPGPVWLLQNKTQHRRPQKVGTIH
jgi:hypothetical protein